MENDRKSSRADTERYNLEILLRRPSLRASIPRRISQMRRETMTTPDTTCGIGCIRGQWLQSFANRTTFIIVYEVLGSFYASYVAYFYGTITTLEKRFKFSNQTAGIIAASGDISKVVTCLVLSLFPLNVHKPRSLGVGVFVIILSAVMFTLPHFLHGPERELNGWDGNATHHKNENCTEPNRICSNGTQENAFSLFLLTQVLHGIGGGLYLTQGKRYKEDNIRMQRSPSLISLLSILKTLGPAFGYWLSSVCLKTHASLEKVTDENDTHWIGAWWLGNLVIGFILFVVGFLLILFPPILPKAAVRRIFNNIRGRDEVKGSFTGGINKTVKSLLSDSGFSFTHFSGTFNVVGFLAYFIFLPKYVEIQYRISASTANLIVGSISLISAAFGIVMTSSVITRYRPNARALASWTIIVGVLSTGGLISYNYLGCTENDTQIKTIASKYSRLDNFCACGFHPICIGSEIQVPCQIEYEGILHNGTMLNKNFSQAADNKGFLKGLCPVNCNSNFLLFIIATCAITFIYSTGRTSNTWLEIRHPDNTHKSQALGLNFINILAFIPAPIIFGYILDKSCLLWDDNCTSTGNCWLYHNENLRNSMNFTAIGFSIVGIIIDVGVWYSVKNLTLFHDDDNEYSEQNDDS